MIWQLESTDCGIFYLTQGQYTLGRYADNDLVIEEDGVSGHHAQIDCDEHSLFLRDLASTNGVFLNGGPVEGAIKLKSGDRFSLGEQTEFELAKLELPADPPLLIVASPTKGHWCLPPGKYTFGREDHADIVIDDPDVSRQHARIEFDGNQARLFDLGSSNGTFNQSGSIDETVLRIPEMIWLGPSPLFLAAIDVHASAPATAPAAPTRKPAQRPPPPAESLPAAAWVFLAIVTIGTIGGAVWYLGDFSIDDLPTTHRTAAEIEQERERQARIQRAHQTVSTVAMDTELREHLRALARQTETIETTMRPVLDELDRAGDMLQQVTGNPVTRRLIAGTELEPVADGVHRLTRTSRSFMNDVRRMPQDLAALDQALARYQSRQTLDNLNATIRPAQQALQQGRRIHLASRGLENSLGLTTGQLDGLAATSRNWRIGSEISPVASRVAGELRQGKQAVGAYRQRLDRDLQRIQRLERDAAAASQE